VSNLAVITIKGKKMEILQAVPKEYFKVEGYHLYKNKKNVILE